MKLHHQVPYAIAAGCVVLALIDLLVRMLSVGDDEAYIWAAISLGLRLFLVLCGLVAAVCTLFVVGRRWPHLVGVIGIVGVSLIIIATGDALYDSASATIP